MWLREKHLNRLLYSMWITNWMAIRYLPFDRFHWMRVFGNSWHLQNLCTHIQKTSNTRTGPRTRIYNNRIHLIYCVAEIEWNLIGNLSNIKQLTLKCRDVYQWSTERITWLALCNWWNGHITYAYTPNVYFHFQYVTWNLVILIRKS